MHQLAMSSNPVLSSPPRPLSFTWWGVIKQPQGDDLMLGVIAEFIFVNALLLLLPYKLLMAAY